MTEQRDVIAATTPLRVSVVGPPLSASGGIGRVMSYALSALDEYDVAVRVLDTRGLRSSPWSSILHLVRACGVLLWLAVRHRVDVVHINVSSHGSTLRKGVLVRVCRLAGLPVVLHLHASSFPGFYDSLPGWAQRWVRNTFGSATRVVVLARFWRTYVEDSLGVPPERVSVLPNAAPAAAAHGRVGGSSRPTHLVFLGRLGPRKGVPELLDALADPRVRKREWRATLAGDGDVSHYRARAAELGLEGRITFPGWVDTAAVGELLADSHVLVLPSHAEGSPISVLEAFAAGIPVVCTPVGGLAEVVIDQENGLLVPPGAVRELADALLRMLDDEGLRARLAAGASDAWKRNHTIEGYAGRLMLEWQQAARRTPPPAQKADRLLTREGS